MAPSHPKYPNRRRSSPAAAAPRRRPATVELPFDDGEVLDADDPRPQRVAQLPTTITRVAPPRRQEEAIPTTIYNLEQDEALPQDWDSEPVSDPGFKPAYLYVEKGPGQGQLLPIKQGALVIGRASISDLSLPHPSISRRHAQLTRLGERFYLKDLGSQNGTLVNKTRIETEIEVYPGDLIAVGTALLKLRGATDRISPETQKQIKKVQTSKRKALEAPPPRAKKPAARSQLMAVAAACVAIGFGLAALAFAILKATQQRPTETAPAVQPLLVEATAPVVERSSPEAKVEVAPEPSPQLDLPVPSPAPKVAAPTPAPAPRPVERAKPVRARPEPKPAKTVATRREPAPPPPSNAAILARYEEGDVSGAITLARAAGDSELLGKLSDFQTAYAGAERAEKANDGTTAIREYQRALSIDEKLSGGWGKHGPIISKKLGHLYALVGQHYMKQADAENAQLAFKAALKYAPDNAVAKSHLAQLDTAEAKAAPAPRAAPARKAAIADAWEDAAADESTAQDGREKRVDAIEDAWND